MLLALVLQPALATAQPASPADLERAEAKAIEAKVFFKSGLYAEAATGFMQAFAISRRPDMMFNAARAYEEAGVPAQAIALFEQYQKLTDAPADGKRDAAQRIAKQTAQLDAARAKAKEAQAPAAVVPSPTPAAAPAPAAAAVAESGPAPSPVQVSVPAPAPAPAPASPPSKALTIGLLAGGGALTLLGVLSWTGAVSKINTANNMDFSLPDAAKTYKTNVRQAQDARNFGIGAAVLGIGVAAWGGWRLWKAPSSKTADKPLTFVAPTFDAGGGGLAWGGTF